MQWTRRAKKAVCIKKYACYETTDNQNTRSCTISATYIRLFYIIYICDELNMHR
jgi:hypothetical protein